MSSRKPKPSSVATLAVATSAELAPPKTRDPYARSRFDRANLYEAQGKALRRSQALALVLGVAVLGLLGGLLYHTAQTRIRPYVVEVDRHGQVVAYGPAEEMAEPDRRVLLHTLTLWITRVRTVSMDKAIERREVLAAYALTGGRATELLNGWFRAHPPFTRAETESVSVAVESLLAVEDTERRFHLQWTESIRNRAGLLLRQELWQALVTLEVDPPDRVEEILANPLGIRVVDFDWQRLSTHTGSSLKNP